MRRTVERGVKRKAPMNHESNGQVSIPLAPFSSLSRGSCHTVAFRPERRGSYKEMHIMSTHTDARDMNLLELHVELISTYLAVYLPETVGEQRQAVDHMVKLKRRVESAEQALRQDDPDELATVYLVHIDQLGEVIAQRKRAGAFDTREIDLLKKLETHHEEYVSRLTALVRAKQKRETTSLLFGVR